MTQETKLVGSRNNIIIIAAGAIFGALSMALSPFTGSIPKISVGWGMSILDPISIIWLICFLIFGWKSGLLASGIGTVGIALLSPEPVAWLGALMKFSATISFIIVPTILAKLRDLKAIEFKRLKIYGSSSGLAILLRCALMIPMNIFFAMGIYAAFFGMSLQEVINVMTIWLAPIGLTGWGAVILTIAVMNIWQSLWDIAVPYLVVFPTKIAESYATW
ncbi:MAG TPA: hypothetical protein VMV49_09100 [Candidatus Deferrimicrobium sp.]|nr:hypothetical protein [Candidatus Deferrimicrobium sp.]